MAKAKQAKGRIGPRRAIENAIQRAYVAWIRDGWPDVKVIATLNENSMHCMDLGCDLGITDLILMKRHRAGALRLLFQELKTLTGDLQQSQIDWKAAYDSTWSSSNTAYVVSYGFEKAKQDFLRWYNVSNMEQI